MRPPPKVAGLPLLTPVLGRQEETEGGTHFFSSGFEHPILLATHEPDPTLLGLGASQTMEEKAGVRSLLSALCFSSLYLGILVPRVVCFEMRKFVQRSGPHPWNGEFSPHRYAWE